MQKPQEEIWARNNETGVENPVPKELFDIQTYLWTRCPDPRVTKAEAEANAKVVKLEKEAKEDEADVVMTGAGNPFKTENAAKATMKKKGLSEDLWMTTEVPNGFVITRK